LDVDLICRPGWMIDILISHPYHFSIPATFLHPIHLPSMDDFKIYYYASAGAGIAGILSHLVYFIRGEHHQYAHRWITRALAGTAAVAIATLRLTDWQPLLSLILTALISTSYFLGLYSSIGIYRVFFHPLRRFKGPFWARASNLYHMYIIRKSDNYLVMKKMHEKYGPIIRTGKDTPCPIVCFSCSVDLTTTRTGKPLSQRSSGNPPCFERPRNVREGPMVRPLFAIGKSAHRS
jgi:hypothetical protein